MQTTVTKENITEVVENTEKRPIRVASIIGMTGCGGVESVIMNYYRHIDRTRVQFDFFVEETSKIVDPAVVEEMGGKVIIIPPYKNVPKYVKTLTQLFKDGNYDIVHSNMNTVSCFPLFAAKRAGIKIRLLHNHSTSGKGELLRNSIKGVLRPWAKCWATDRCACSELAGQWMYGEKAMQAGEIKVWNNAVDLKKFAYNEETRAALREQHGWQEKHIYGHVGRFMHQKNHDFLIDIFDAVRKIDDKAHLLLIGGGKLEEEIREKVKRLGLEEHVTFLGMVANVCDYYSVMDLFLLPSFYEGLPVVGVEAQAAGLPCLFSDAITKETLMLYTADMLSLKDSAETWAKTAFDMINANSDRVSPEGMETLRAKFDIEKAAECLLAYYEELMK